MKKVVIICIALVLSVFAESNAQPPALVNVSALKQSSINPLTQFTGTVKFNNQSKIASQSNGSVKSIYFEAGQKVKKNDILLKIDSELLDANIQASKAKVKISEEKLINVKKDYERYKALLKSKSIAQKIYDDAYLNYILSKQNVLVSKAVLKDLLIQKKKKVIRAPFDGVIAEKNINIDEWLNKGQTIAVLINTDEIEVMFHLPLDYVKGLNKSLNYEMYIGQSKIKAKLYAAIPKGDKLTRTFPVKFKAKNIKEFIFDGAQAKISLAKDSKIQALVINRDAVIKRFGQNVVFIIGKNNKAMMMPVKVVGYDGQMVAIKAKGLKQNMNIVVKGNERIFPNQAVQIIK